MSSIFLSNLSFDGKHYTMIAASKYSHAYSRGLADYRGQALTTGCHRGGDCNLKTELLDIRTMTWSEGKDYPFTDE